MSEERFGRIEIKLDEIARALNTLVRLEERQLHHGHSIDKLISKTDSLEERVGMAERRLDAGSVRIGYGERITWAIVSAAMATAAAVWGLKK